MPESSSHQYSSKSISAPHRFLPYLLAISAFMQMLDATILNTALPTIAADMHESPLQMQSAVISYALTLALVMPLSGYLCDRYGSRRVFAGALSIFVFGSILCAASQNLWMLVCARVVQALGGAMLLPVSRMVLMRAYHKDRILSILNIVLMPALLGPILGPLVGGYLVDYASWHWIFLINVPIGCVGLGLALSIMPDFYAVEKMSRFDLLGFLLFASAAAGLTLAIEIFIHVKVPEYALLLLGIGFGSLYAYWRHAHQHPHPLYSLNLLQVRTYRLGLIGNMMSRLGMSAVPFLLPLLFQVAFMYSASASGWMLAPIAIATLLAKPLIKPLMQRFGYRSVLIVNTRLLGIFIAFLSSLSADSSVCLSTILLLIIGLCNSIQFSAMNTIALSNLRLWQTGSGNSLLAVNQQLSIGFGIAFGAMLLNSFSSNQYLQWELTQAFQLTFIILGCVTFLSSWVFTALHPRDGSSLVAKKKNKRN